MNPAVVICFKILIFVTIDTTRPIGGVYADQL